MVNRSPHETARSPVDPHSTLTHVLPLVSKQFHKLCSAHDLYWKQGLVRLIKNDAYLWEEGLKRVVFDAHCDALRDKLLEQAASTRRYGNARGAIRRAKRTKEDTLTSTVESAMENHDCTSTFQDSDYTTKEENLLDQGCRALQTHPPRHHTATSSGIYQCLYRSILLRHLRYQGPVFYMPTRIRLGSEYGLHFFEPRYRLLISEVMSSFPVSARRGGPISPMVPGLSPPSSAVAAVASRNEDVQNLFRQNRTLLQNHHLPTFIHAHQSPLCRNAPACIVQVLNCIIQPDGSADVFLQPMAYVFVEELWERPGTGGLYEARGIRMGKETSERYEMWCELSGCLRGAGRGMGQALPVP